jgi:hypothetical protein
MWLASSAATSSLDRQMCVENWLFCTRGLKRLNELQNTSAGSLADHGM